MLFKKKKAVKEAPAKLSAEERLAQLVLQIDQSDLKDRAQAALKEVVDRQNAKIARHEAIKEVKEFAEENPDAAGSILKNWLLEQKAKR
jgi:flagellar biosynthesis/type III secretory pathway M-ring protein FliF/YscJ